MRYATRINHIISESRDLVDMMSLTETPGLISFAGGFPSPDTYPIKDITETMIEIMRDDPRGALSYSHPAGYPELREQIRLRMKKNFAMDFADDEIMLVSGSQQGLDLSGLLFIDPDDVILFESPSYLGALSALKTYEASLVAIDTDADGMRMDELEKAFAAYGDRIKLVYVNTDFQNPTGRSWSGARREAFIKLMENYDVAILEDAAYAELSYSDERMRPLISYDRKGQVVYIGTFSKTFCPGLRTGWICGSREVINRFLILKTNVDLSPATILQRQVAYYLKNRDLDAHIRNICGLYRKRRDVMYAAIRREFPEDSEYSLPGGGLFFWVKLPDYIDTRSLLLRAITEKVAFMPGGAFYPDSRQSSEMRLNFSNMSCEDIEKGISVLGRLIREYVETDG